MPGSVFIRETCFTGHLVFKITVKIYTLLGIETVYHEQGSAKQAPILESILQCQLFFFVLEIKI